MSNPLEDLGLDHLQAIAQVRDIKDYEGMSRDELLSIIFPSKKSKKSKKKGKKSKASFSKARIKEVSKVKGDYKKENNIKETRKNRKRNEPF